jgi:hypothetical protein
MGSLLGFLEGLIGDGRVVFRERPDLAPRDRDRAEELLREFFDDEALGLAGPAPQFDAKAALWAAEWTRLACWLLLSRSESAGLVGEVLRVPAKAGTPGQQLSADLTFRYLPLVHRRARALSPGDLLTTRLEELLRRWPLSGVLSDVQEEPLTPLDWGPYPGLGHLYAERLARHPKTGWTPAEGKPTREIVELVRASLARVAPQLPDNRIPMRSHLG